MKKFLKYSSIACLFVLCCFMFVSCSFPFSKYEETSNITLDTITKTNFEKDKQYNFTFTVNEDNTSLIIEINKSETSAEFENPEIFLDENNENENNIIIKYNDSENKNLDKISQTETFNKGKYYLTFKCTKSGTISFTITKPVHLD